MAMRIDEGLQVVVALLDRLDVVDDEVELAVGEHRVDAAEPLRRLRPGQERHDDADRQRPPEAQAARRGTRREPSSSITARIRSRVSALTTCLPLSARDAVATLTPAWRATSRIVTAFFVTVPPDE